MRPLPDPPELLSRADAEVRVPGYRVFSNTRALYSVRLWGPLDGLWSARFSIGLSSIGLSILNGFARQDGIGRWGAEFLVTPTVAALDPMDVDYLALTMTELHETRAGSLVLFDYALDGSPEHGAVLYLEIRAPDQVGFLGRLIRVLAGFGLVPREMTISTCDGQAFDRFLLQTAGGRIPSDDTRRGLAVLLDGMVQGRIRPEARARAHSY